jgi:hypothetical protein
MNPRPSSVFTVAATLLAFAAPALCQVKIEIDKEVKVKQWGYVIRPLKGWNSMPADQEDRFTVGRWKLALDEFEKRGNYEMVRTGGLCELKIVRIQSKVETPAAKESEKDKPQPVSLLGKPAAKSMDEWIENTWDGAAKRWLRVPLKGGKMPGDLLEFGSGASHVTIGVFRRLGVEWAVVYTSFEENYQKMWKDWYLKSIQTFEVVENVDPDVAAAANKDPSLLKGEEKRAALNASIAGKPGWFSVNTKYYVFLSNADKQFVTQLSKDLELVREKVYVPNFKPRNQDIPLNPVRVFATQSEYHQFGGPQGSAGYFSPTKGELVLFQRFEEQSKNSSEKDCKSVMFHEGFHQYVHFAIGDVSPHSWFNEGTGDYFAGLAVNGGQVGETKVFEWRVNFLKTKMREGADLIPLRSLLRYPQSEYYTNAGLKYSEGWAIIYYIRNVSKNKAYKQALETYFNYLADNVTAFRAKKKKDGDDDDKPRGEPIPGIPGVRVIDFEDQKKVDEILSQAIDKAFAAIDLEALDKELRAWVDKL